MVKPAPRCTAFGSRTSSPATPTCCFLSSTIGHRCVRISVLLLPSTQTRQIQPTMSQVAKDTAKDLSSVPATKNHKIRITLTSRNVKNLEKVCGDLVNRSKDKDLRVKGPVRLPTKRLHIVTRKTVRPAHPFPPLVALNHAAM